MSTSAAIARFRLGIGKSPIVTGPERPVIGRYPEPRPTALARREAEQGPATAQAVSNAQREAEYIARRNGMKPPLLQVWRL